MKEKIIYSPEYNTQKNEKWSIDDEPFILNLDIASCNLRCAMCPNGKVSGLINNTRGLMGYGLFRKIIDKFVAENVKVWLLFFGNWGEPLLNHDISKMIRYAKLKPGFLIESSVIEIATNLNYLHNPVELIESGVDCISVSISGMTQEVYEKNHRGGNINIVLDNILQLVEIKKRNRSDKPHLRINFHDTIYNKKDQNIAKKFCSDNELEFCLRRMYICSVDDNIRFQEEKEKFSKFYCNFIDLDKEIYLATTVSPRDITNCFLRTSYVVINSNGQLYRCCGVFEEEYYMGSIFDFRIIDIPNIESKICQKCVNTPISWRSEICYMSSPRLLYHF